jgi:hypothetical protein
MTVHPAVHPATLRPLRACCVLAGGGRLMKLHPAALRPLRSCCVLAPEIDS